jgi:hypothetical protein
MTSVARLRQGTSTQAASGCRVTPAISMLSEGPTIRADGFSGTNGILRRNESQLLGRLPRPRGLLQPTSEIVSLTLLWRCRFNPLRAVILSVGQQYLPAFFWVNLVQAGTDVREFLFGRSDNTPVEPG